MDFAIFFSLDESESLTKHFVPFFFCAMVKSYTWLYRFFHKGRQNKKGGGLGIFVSDDIKAEASICEHTVKRVGFTEEQFENIVVRIPECISINNHSDTKNNHSNNDITYIHTLPIFCEI